MKKTHKPNSQKIFLCIFLAFFIVGISFGQSSDKVPNNMIRIAEIEIEPEFIDDYLAILKEEAEASIRLEPGVICIYPMYQKESPTEIRLLEIYADTAAYESHLQTPHFKHYKTTTIKMVKSLKLVDMEAIDPATMPQIFVKLNTQ